ncbi:hypothetical protein KDK95_00130 [Actinospica sp. MGRD01-02]|uniref:Uncharacterized protein n=1 Tax=Actinospica acidithermotolerans TaxID=2828514 RepID=A0A941IH08_9ACTN|nr:hypothetical protein [Actinospica acidithermotolerans]MBR7824698.1 hypothetical protein [Actinospica acidithermotolerans]
MAGGYQVDVAALRSFAQVADAQEQQLERIHQTLAGVQIDGDAFGLLPASGDLHSAYTAHAQAEVENTAEAAQLLHETGAGLEQTAVNYGQTEQAITEMYHNMRGQLGGGRG